MSASQNMISNLSKDKYSLKAQSTTTITFNGANPNYYRITNGGDTALYLGVSMMPTENFFDQKISPATTKLYVDAYGHEEIYIYNPSLKDINVVITSFTAPFEPTVLGLSDIGQDFSQIEFSGEVDASGNLKTLITSINKKIVDYTNLLTAIESKIGNSDSKDYTAYLLTIENKIVSVFESIDSLLPFIRDIVQNETVNYDELYGLLQSFVIDYRTDIANLHGTVMSIDGKTYDYGNLLVEIKEALTSSVTKCTKWYKGENTDAENKYTMKYIELLSNDSDSDLFVTISSTGNITLKPGEVLNKIMLDAVRTITIPKNSTYRLIGG